MLPSLDLAIVKRWTKRCLVAGGLVLALTLLLSPWNPTRSCGVPSLPPIIAVELATSVSDLANVFGEGACRASMVASLRIVNWIDFAYMAAYGAFLFCGVRALRARGETRLLALATVAAVIAPLADAVENVCLLAMNIDAPGAWLSLLMVASRTKFVLIGFVALALGLGMWRETSPRRLLAVAQLPALPLVLAGVFVPAALPAIVPAIATSWIGLIAWAALSAFN